MPWSAKAQELLEHAVRRRRRGGAASALGGDARPRSSSAARGRRRSASCWSTATAREPTTRTRFVEAYRRYCWPVESLADLRLAPFHLLASEGAVHVDHDHAWHMERARPRSPRPTALLLATDAPSWSTSTDPASAAAGDRVVGGADRGAAARAWS